MTSRYSTKRSNSGPSQASVASAFAFAFVAIVRATLFDAQPVQEAFVAAPALPHADAKVEEDAAAEQRLHLLARTGAHVAHHAPALADEDALLRLGLGPRVRDHGDQPVLAFLDLVDLD